MHNTEKNTLVVLTPGFPVSETDSTCLPLQQALIRNLKKNYPLLNIIVFSLQYPYHENTYQWFDISVFCFNGQNKGGLKRILLRTKIISRLEKLHRETPLLGILSFWYGECALVGKQFCDSHNLKHYCWILGQDALKQNKYPKRIAARSDELIALSDFLQNEFERNHHTRPQHLIPPGIDDINNNVKPVERNIDILGVGSLIPLKKYDLFLEIITKIKQDFPAIKTMLVGDGPEKESLQALVVKYNLKDNCMLTGELAYNEVLALMQRTKILLHTSSYEGFSGVCQEALYCDCHVISFCRAMKTEIPQWHIVEDKAQMVTLSLNILNDPLTGYQSINPYPMTEISRKIMNLFSA